MTLPELFIGSSKKNIPVAKTTKQALDGDCARVRLWSEEVFGLNEGYLYNLIRNLTKCEYAAFVFAGDDLTTSKGESKSSPRDNVLFESGLFMWALGPDNVFLIYHEAIGINLPSD